MELLLDSMIFLGTMTLIVVYLWFVSLQVVNARAKYNIQPPKTSGNIEFEKIYRIQVNTFETAILYIPLFSILFFISNGFISAGMIILWLISRVIFQRGYSKDVKSRTLGFKLQQITFFISLGIILIQIIRFFI